MRVVTLPSKDLQALSAALGALKAAAAAADDPAAVGDAKRRVVALLEALEARHECPGAMRGAVLEDVPLEQALGLCRRRVESVASLLE